MREDDPSLYKVGVYKVGGGCKYLAEQLVKGKESCPTKHKKKKIVEYENMDGEVYYECPDCHAGWRALPDKSMDMSAVNETLEIDMAAILKK